MAGGEEGPGEVVSHHCLSRVCRGEDQMAPFFDAFKCQILKNSLKCPAQSYCCIIVVPSSLPTSWPTLVVADWLTTRSRSSWHPTSVLRNFCFTRPKHQSGAKFVWPTTRNEISMRSFKPHSTLHVRYCMTNLCIRNFCELYQASIHCLYLFLFCPTQLSAWSSSSVSPKELWVRKWCR